MLVCVRVCMHVCMQSVCLLINACLYAECVCVCVFMHAYMQRQMCEMIMKEDVV